jgi:proline iminopeptidase
MRWIPLSLTLVALCVLHTDRILAASPLAPGAHDLALQEVRLHYVVRGHGPVLFVVSPGWGIGSNYLQETLAPLQSHLTLLFIDTRGSGGSTQPADRARMSQSIMADDVDELRQQLGLESIDLFGHSDGGAIAIEYALRHPQHLRRLLLIDPGVLGDRDAAATRATLELWADDPQYHDAVQAANSDDSGPDLTLVQFERALNGMLPLYLSDPSRYLASLRNSLRSTHLSVYAQVNEAAAEQRAARDQRQDAEQIRAHTLIINGTLDWVCPYPVAQRLHANVGHLPWIEQPRRFFNEVVRFLAP